MKKSFFKKNIYGKRGVSSLIAWVLLIGFAVTLAVFVSRWSLQQAQKSTEGVESMIEGDILCSEVNINIICEGSSLYMINRGSLAIKQIKIGNNNPQEMSGERGLMPKDRTGISGKADEWVIPIIVNEKGKLVYCITQKEKIIACIK